MLPGGNRHCQRLPAGLDPAGRDGSFPSLLGCSRGSQLSNAGLEGCCAGWPRGDVPPEERCWGLAQLLGSQPSPGDWSSSSSVCTEDFAARFWEVMVEPLLFSEEEEDEPSGDVSAEGDGPGQDESLFPAGRRLDGQQPLAVAWGRHPVQGRAPLLRKESLESLGGRISRLSQSHALGTAWGGPGQAPLRSQPWAEKTPHRGPCPGEDLLAIALCGGDLDTQRALGTSASRRTRARRGSPDGAVPGPRGAGTRGHPANRSLGPSAVQGQHGGDFALALDKVEEEGAGRRQRRAPCPPRSESGLALGCRGNAGGGWRTGTKQGPGPGTPSLGRCSELWLPLLVGSVCGVQASPQNAGFFFPTGTDRAAGPPGQCGTRVAGSSCPGGAAEPRGQRGKQKAIPP